MKVLHMKKPGKPIRVEMNDWTPRQIMTFMLVFASFLLVAYQVLSSAVNFNPVERTIEAAASLVAPVESHCPDGWTNQDAAALDATVVSCMRTIATEIDGETEQIDWLVILKPLGDGFVFERGTDFGGGNWITDPAKVPTWSD